MGARFEDNQKPRQTMRFFSVRQCFKQGPKPTSFVPLAVLSSYNRRRDSVKLMMQEIEKVGLLFCPLEGKYCVETCKHYYNLGARDMITP